MITNQWFIYWLSVFRRNLSCLSIVIMCYCVPVLTYNMNKVFMTLLILNLQVISRTLFYPARRIVKSKIQAFWWENQSGVLQNKMCPFLRQGICIEVVHFFLRNAFVPIKARTSCIQCWWWWCVLCNRPTHNWIP